MFSALMDSAIGPAEKRSDYQTGKRKMEERRRSAVAVTPLFWRRTVEEIQQGFVQRRVVTRRFKGPNTTNVHLMRVSDGNGECLHAEIALLGDGSDLINRPILISAFTALSRGSNPSTPLQNGAGSFRKGEKKKEKKEREREWKATERGGVHRGFGNPSAHPRSQQIQN